MAIRVDWDNTDKTVIRFDFQGSWTWGDLYRASDIAAAMLETVEHIVDFVLDVRRASQIPSDFMSHAGHIASGTNPRRGILVVIGANFFMRTIGGTLLRLFPDAGKDVMLVGSPDEAYTLIKQQRKLR